MADSVLKIKITLPPEVRTLSQNVRPEELTASIKRGMDRSLAFVRGRIQEQRLSGKGPFPKEDSRLGERSGKLRDKAREEPAVIQGNVVTGAIGLGFPGIVHEFGMLIRGKPILRFQIDGKWIQAKAVIIPPRKVMRVGVAENVEFITKEIASEVEKEFTRT
jgi:hypothetical protein